MSTAIEYANDGNSHTHYFNVLYLRSELRIYSTLEFRIGSNTRVLFAETSEREEFNACKADSKTKEFLIMKRFFFSNPIVWKLTYNMILLSDVRVNVRVQTFRKNLLIYLGAFPVFFSYLNFPKP